LNFFHKFNIMLGDWRPNNTVVFDKWPYVHNIGTFGSC